MGPCAEPVSSITRRAARFAWALAAATLGCSAVEGPGASRLGEPSLAAAPARPGADESCGDGVCEPEEARGACLPDCGAELACGDGLCQGAETCSGCSSDCGSCAALLLMLTEAVTDAALAQAESTMGALEAALLTDLGAAKTTIHAALYTLTRQNIVTALIAARARGVTVTVATECESRAASGDDAFFALQLAGVEVVDDGSSFQGTNSRCPLVGGTMHDKVLVIDERIVWTGSVNMTWTDLNYNRNHAVRIDSADVARLYGAELAEMRAGRFGAAKSGPAGGRYPLVGGTVEIAFSPQRREGESASRELVHEAVLASRQSIRFAVFSFTDSLLAEALVQAPAFSAGMVQGIVDASGAASASSQFAALCAAGVSVVVENFAGKVHHKLAILDAEAPSEAAIVVGSTNWSVSGFESNDENLLLIHDGAAVRAASSEYEQLLHARPNEGLACCLHSAESWNEQSDLCGGVPCICQDGLDGDHDGFEDADDADCAAPFVCSGV